MRLVLEVDNLACQVWAEDHGLQHCVGAIPPEWAAEASRPDPLLAAIEEMAERIEDERSAPPRRADGKISIPGFLLVHTAESMRRWAAILKPDAPHGCGVLHSGGGVSAPSTSQEEELP